MDAKRAIKIIEQDGWRLARVHGSHYIFHHPTKTGIVVVPFHASSDLKGTSNNCFAHELGSLNSMGCVHETVEMVNF
jgi:predicted RNA binding protein YcfA (HicA-like mRNA interferase family)